MKKNRPLCIRGVSDPPRELLSRLVRMIAPLLLFAMMCHGAYAQQQSVTLRLNDVTLEEALVALQNHTGANFLYNSSLLAGTSRVSLASENQTLRQVLQNILWQQGLDFDYTNGVIVLKKREAQTRQQQIPTVTGRVVDSEGNAIHGASVMVKGTKYGVSTDGDGGFNLQSPAPFPITLTISYIGMGQKEVVVAASEPRLVVRMEVDQLTLKELVVTGYNVVDRRYHTGNPTVISQEELLKVSPSNILHALQIFDPSFKVMENNERGSDPNNISTIYIRGRSGLGDVSLPDDPISEAQLRNDPNLPTFILDGYEVSVDKIFDLDPSRVESISILKDAASTAIYGSRAANGVVVIETVKPKAGELRIRYMLNGSFSTPDLSAYNLLNAADKLRLEQSAGIFNPTTNEQPSASLLREQSYYDKLAQINRGVDTYWLAKPLRTAWNHKHQISLEGGTNEFIFSVDLKLDRTNGVMKGSERYGSSIGFSLSYRVKNIQFRNYIEWSNVRSANSPYGSFSTYAEKNPYDTPYDDNGELVSVMRSWYGHSGVNTNPLYDATLNSYDRTVQNEFSNNANFKWFIADGLHFDARLVLSNLRSRQNTFIDPASSLYSTVYDHKLRGKKTVADRNSNSWDFNSFLTYNTLLGKNHLNISLGVNARQQDMDRSSYTLTGFMLGNTDDINFAADMESHPSGATDVSRLFGLFSSINYTYDNIYLFDFSTRYDGSSQFGANVQFAPFWSVGAGINIHNYQAVKNNAKWIDNLKLRVNYGLVGKAGFPQSLARSTYTYDFEHWYATGLGASLISLANPDLEWEKTYMFDTGIDIRIFNRLQFSLTYYHKKTIDLIGDLTLPLSTGFASYKSNLGEILNEGIELSVRYQLVNNKVWNLSAYGTMSRNKNKFLKISDTLKEYNLRVEEYYRSHRNSAPLPKYYEGSSQTAIYAMKSLGINPADGREVYLKRDGSTTFTWDAAELVNTGDSEPKARGSFGFNLTYRSFYAFAGMIYEYGGWLYNETLVYKVENANVYRNVDSRVFTQRWQKAGDRTTLKNIRNWNTTTQATSRFVQRNNYIDLNSITIGYNFPPNALQRWGIGNMRVAATANDLGRIATISRERGTGYPFARTINFSVNMTF